MPSPRSSHRLLIETLARSRQLDPDLLEAQILVESSDNLFAFRYEPAFYHHYLAGKLEWTSWGPLAACSYGLLQILGAVAVELGFTGAPQDLFVPNTNLFYGTKKLARLRDQCSGNMDAAVASYNGGLVGNVLPPYRNQVYLQKVLDIRASFEGALRA